jgi:Tol biopolymer transport system component
VTGQPTPVLEGVFALPFEGSAQFSISDDGNLVYVTGHAGFQPVSIYWMDRQGKFTPLRETPAVYCCPTFSPDGKRLALQISDGRRSDIWVYEWEHDTLTRLTFGTEDNYLSPLWTPDGQRITYASFDETRGVGELYWKRADGTGDAQRLTETRSRKFADSWRPDGRVLAFDQLTSSASNSWEILTMSIEGNEKSGWKPGEPKPFLSGPFTQNTATFSLDGRWVAYTSNESGNYEVYVRPFPGPGGKWQVSTDGGSSPNWSRKGREIVYRTEDNKIMVANYTASGDSFHADKPQRWSPGQFTDLGGSINEFDLHPDGKRIAVLKAPGGEALAVNKVSFIFNFFDELRRKVPSGKD